MNFSHVIGLLAPKFTWSWPYFWPLKNDSRANLVAFYRFSSVYVSGRPETEAGAGVQETAGIGLGVPLSLVKAPLALRRVWSPAI